MTSLSINRLAVAFLILSTITVVLTGGYFGLEMNTTFHTLSEQERDSARHEVKAGLTEVTRILQTSGENLAKWDETRQQLIFPEYYQIWRDVRVRDAGLAPRSIVTVALYDKNNHIISQGAGPMPSEMRFRTDTALLAREQGQDYLYYFLPVHATPDGGVLLGYVALKALLTDLLRQAQMYRYADLTNLQSGLAEGQTQDLEEAARSLRYTIRPNSELERFHQIFNSSLMRLVLVILLSLLAASWLLRKVIVEPLRQLSIDIDRMSEHDSSLPKRPRHAWLVAVQELDNLYRSFSEHHARLSHLFRDLTRSTRNFYDQARRDSLTGIYNRRAFDEDWRGLDEDRRLGRVALMLFDCDHFKAINDTYGHPVGDAVIQAIASCLQQALRTNDRLYRIGGDEFATVLSDGDPQHAASVAERCMVHMIEYDFRAHGISEPCTISIGIAVSDQEGQPLSELQKRADLAMYTAKRPGFSKIQFYNEDMGNMSSLVGNREINVVFQAIQDASLIELVYQPVLRLPLMEEEYVEALARIRMDGHIIRPGAIFPIVQARGLDAEFDLSVIRAVDRDLACGKISTGHGLSLNISAPSIVHARVIDALLDLVARHIGRKLVIEITETALITQMDLATSNIQRLRAAGAVVALDDFGSGYSSLRYLASMPVDLVKFDISMVRLLESGTPRQKLMIEEIARLVITAGYELVAEGIETREMLDKVISLGFSHAQGYYFGKPVEPIDSPSTQVVEQG